MRRIRLLFVVSILAALVGGATAPATATAAYDDVTLVCGGETVTFELPIHSGSWTMREADGASLMIVHRWVVTTPDGPDVLVDRATGNPRLELCTGFCPMGYPMEVWGIRTPVGAR